jgi:formylmethanofuran:tetrahydromethanopterin formyltransferase
MKIQKTFKATISLGFRVGYLQKIHKIDEVERICHDFCDKIGLCVTITPTTFIYSRRTETPDGWEDGCFVELIQYPRFPDSEENIRERAIELAKILMKNFGQTKVSVICTDNTYMLEPEDII